MKLFCNKTVALQQINLTREDSSMITIWHKNVLELDALIKHGFVRIVSFVSSEVADKVLNGQVVTPYESIRFNTEYKLLSKFAGFKQQWFGSVVNTKTNVFGVTSNSNIILVLDIPVENIRLSDYYTWVDFMYFTQTHCDNKGTFQNHDDNEITEAEYNNISSLLFKPTFDGAVQAIFEEIRPEWLVGCYCEPDNNLLCKFDGNGGVDIMLLDLLKNLPAYKQSKL